MKITRKQLRQIIKEELSRISEAVKVATTERGGYTVDGQWLDVSGEDMTPSEALTSLASVGVTHVVDDDADGARYTLSDWKNKVGKSQIDSDGDGALDADELRKLAADLEGEEEKPLRLSAPTMDSIWQLKAKHGIGQGTGPYDKYGKRKKGWRSPLAKDPKK